MPGAELVQEESGSSVALDVIQATKVVRSGLSYDMLCAVCGEMIREDVRTRRAPYYNRERIAAHVAVCVGPRKQWWRRMLSGARKG